MKYGLVTVLMPVYNQAHFIHRAIQSVYHQTYIPELIIIDDGSTDNLKTVLTQLKNNKIILISHKKNRGQAHAMNTGLSHINTKYFVQLDADDWFQPDTIEIMLRVMEKQAKDVALAYGNLMTWLGGSFPQPERIFKGKSFNNRIEFAQLGITYAPRFYRTSCVRDVGGWLTDDPSRGRNLEDLQMMLKLLDKYKFCYIDRLLYNRLIHDNNLYQATSETLRLRSNIIQHYINKWKKRD